MDLPAVNFSVILTISLIVLLFGIVPTKILIPKWDLCDEDITKCLMSILG